MKGFRFGMRFVFAATLLLALIGSACGSTSGTGSGAGATPSAGGGAYGDGYGGGSKGGGGTSSGGASATVEQGSGGQLAFSLATLTVKTGHTIEVSNVASIPHTFTIDGQGIDVVNEGGQSQTVTIGLAPGTYTFVCRFHQSEGMQGTLTVTG
jgi:plastocyanin